MAKIQTKPQSKIDRIRDVHERYADLLTMHHELTIRHGAVLAEIQPLAEQGRRAQVSWVAKAPKQKPLPIKRHAGATALLGDLLPEQPIEEINPPAPRPS